ncbi:MAG: MBOAT family protein, partial [Firmicutes bacterium]|nr:MBOAT family protein [Bacillota bacterium]
MQWNVSLIALLVCSTFINFVFSHRIYRSKSEKKRRALLTFCMVINFGLLFVFKYLDFAEAGVKALISIFSGAQFSQESFFHIILPMGISFYTFQAAGYVIDVYRKKLRPEKHYGIFSLFISFFPQLVAGPIERSTDLLPQFYEKHRFNAESFLSGLKIMLWGFFKKAVIADRAAALAETVVNHVAGFEGPGYRVAAVVV